GAGEHVGSAAAREEPAGRTDAKPTSFRLLQEHEADHGEHDHEVDDDDESLHGTDPLAPARAPGDSSHIWGVAGVCTRGSGAFLWLAGLKSCFCVMRAPGLEWLGATTRRRSPMRGGQRETFPF